MYYINYISTNWHSLTIEFPQKESYFPSSGAPAVQQNSLWLLGQINQYIWLNTILWFWSTENIVLATENFCKNLKKKKKVVGAVIGFHLIRWQHYLLVCTCSQEGRRKRKSMLKSPDQHDLIITSRPRRKIKPTAGGFAGVGWSVTYGWHSVE